MAFVGREGQGDRYFRGGKKNRSVPRENGAQVWFKQGWWTVDDEASCVAKTRRCAKILYIASHTILFSLCFERQNGVTEGKDGV